MISPFAHPTLRPGGCRSAFAPHAVAGVMVCALLPQLIGCYSVAAEKNRLPDSTLWNAEMGSESSQVLFVHSKDQVVLRSPGKPEPQPLQHSLAAIRLLNFLDRNRFAVAGDAPDTVDGTPVRLLLYGRNDTQPSEQFDLPMGTRMIACVNDRWMVTFTDEYGGPTRQQLRHCRTSVWKRTDTWHYDSQIPQVVEGYDVAAARFVDSNTLVLRCVRFGDEEANAEGPGCILATYDLTGRKLANKTTTKLREVGRLSVSSRGQYLALCNSEEAEVYNTATMRLSTKATIRHVADDIPCTAVSDDGRYLAYASARLEVLDTRTGNSLVLDTGHEAVLRSRVNLALAVARPGEPVWPIEDDWFMKLHLCFGWLRFLDGDAKLGAIIRSGEYRVWQVDGWRLLKNERLVEPRRLMAAEKSAIGEVASPETVHP